MSLEMNDDITGRVERLRYVRLIVEQESNIKIKTA